MLVLRGRAAEFERELPYGALVDALDAHLRGARPGRLRGLDTRAARRHLPRAGRLAAVPLLAVERYRAHRAVIDLLGRLAATRPLVLTLDDMHAADPASLELLAALLRRPPQRARAGGDRDAHGPALGTLGADGRACCGSTSARWTPMTRWR